jgi:hypothetical protein
MSAVLLAALTLAGAGFELRLDEAQGARVAAISVIGSDLFVVAAGRDDLAILEPDDAAAALSLLKKNEDFALLLGGAVTPSAPSAATTDAETGARIVVHKMDYEEDLSNDPSGRELRVVSGASRKADPAPGLDETAAAGGASRVIRIFGADEPAALRFIDALEGLDADEKAEMRAAIGL